MRHVLSFFLVAVVAVGVAVWIANLNGHLALDVGTTTVQTPLAWAVVGLLTLIVVLLVLFRLGASVLGLGGAIRRTGQGRSRKRGEAAITSALVALAAREPDAAKREAARARRHLGDTPQTLLVSAYAGTLSGDKQAAQEAFQQLSEHKEGSFLGLRGLLRQAVDAEDWERAADLARQAERAHPGTSFLGAERTHLAVRTGNWREALQLNKGQPSHAALAAAAADAESDPEVARRLAKEAWKRDPLLAPAAIVYARRLRRAGREKAAIDVLRRSFAAAPNPELVTFGLEETHDRAARLKLAAEIVGGAPESGEAHLALGRLELQAGNAQAAERHAEAALKSGLRQRRAYLLLADAAEVLGSDDLHRAAHLDALRMAAGAEADPAWLCEACGSVLEAWRPACPVCHAAGKVRWAVPTRAPRIVPISMESMAALPMDPSG